MSTFRLKNDRLLEVALSQEKVLSRAGAMVAYDGSIKFEKALLVGWVDAPTPSYHYDYQHVRGALTAVGAVTGIALSGEEKQIDFTGEGTVLVQSSEAELMRS